MTLDKTMKCILEKKVLDEDGSQLCRKTETYDATDSDNAIEQAERKLGLPVGVAFGYWDESCEGELRFQSAHAVMANDGDYKMDFDSSDCFPYIEAKLEFIDGSEVVGK